MGRYRSPMLEVFRDAGKSEANCRYYSRWPCCTPDDIALPIVFLCTEAARYITGEIFECEWRISSVRGDARL